MAWTGDFEEKLVDLLGDNSISDPTAAQRWIVDGCYDVLQKAIARYGADEIWKFATKSASQEANHIDIDEIRTIATVVRNSVNATKGNFILKNQYYDEGSIYYATTNAPVWYIDNSKLSIYPSPTALEPANYYYIPEYTITNWNTGVSSIDNYPSEYYYYAMLYAAMKLLGRKLDEYELPIEPVFMDIPEIPAIPLIGDINFVFDESLADAAIAYSATVYANLSTIDVDSFITAPTYTAPSVGTAWASRLADFSALSQFTLVSVGPSALNPPAIESPGVSTMDLPNMSALTVPTYNADTVVGFSGLYDALNSVSISDLTISAVVPTIPTISSITYTPATGVTIASANVDDVTANQLQDLVTIDDISLDDISKNEPDVDSPTHFDITAANDDKPVYVQQSELTFTDLGDAASGEIAAAFEKIIEYIDDEEDVELANARGQEISLRYQDYQTKIQEFQANMQNEVSEFNEKQAIYQGLIQQGTQNAQAANTRALQIMQKDLSVAQANLQKEQQILQANQQKQITIAQANQSNSHAVQQANQQVALQIEQTNASQAQAKALQDATQTTQAIISDNSSKVEKFGQELGKYNAEVQTSIQSFQQNFNKNLQIWQGKQANVLQQHNQKMQDALNLFNKENAVYQAEIQATLSKLQIDAQEAQKESDLTMQAQIQDYTLDLQRHQADVSQYQAEVDSEVQEYGQKLAMELQTWQNEQSNALQQYQYEQQDALNTFNKEQVAYQADVQKQLAEYQSDIQMAIKDGDSTLQTQLTNSAKTMEASITDYNLAVQKYNTLLAKSSKDMEASIQDKQMKLSKVQSDLSKYNAQVQAYQVDGAIMIQNYQALLQGYSAEYQWYSERLNRIKAEYDAKFYAPQQKGEA